MFDLLTFEEWFLLNEIPIAIELAEDGVCLELDYDMGHEYEKRYEDYLISIFGSPLLINCTN